MKAFIMALLLALTPALALAQVSVRSKINRIPESAVANLSNAPASGTVLIVTDGTDDADCDTGGGASNVLCTYDGDNWIPLGDGGGSGGATSLDASFDIGKEIDGATSKANCLRIGNGVEYWCLYYDGSSLIMESGNSAIDNVIRISSNQTWVVYDQEAAADMWTIDPDASSTNAMYTIASAYRPLKSIEWLAGAIETDGTECTDSTTITINSGHKAAAIVCPMGTSETDGFLYGSVTMPDAWDGGTVAFEMNAVIDNDGGAGTFHGDIACQVVADTETVSASYGTGADLDIDEVAGDVVWDYVSVNGDASLTCSGTPAAGNLLLWRWKACDTDASPSTNCTSSTAATITDMSILNVKMEYSVDSFSD